MELLNFVPDQFKSNEREIAHDSGQRKQSTKKGGCLTGEPLASSGLFRYNNSLKSTMLRLETAGLQSAGAYMIR